MMCSWVLRYRYSLEKMSQQGSRHKVRVMPLGHSLHSVIPAMKKSVVVGENRNTCTYTCSSRCFFLGAYMLRSRESREEFDPPIASGADSLSGMARYIHDPAQKVSGFKKSLDLIYSPQRSACKRITKPRFLNLKDHRPTNDKSSRIHSLLPQDASHVHIGCKWKAAVHPQQGSPVSASSNALPFN